MNAISGPAGLQPSSQHRSEAQLDEAAVTHTLRRTGRKAVRFDGWQLIEAIGSDSNSQVWHDLNIYRSTKDAVVVELIVRHSLPDHQDICRVKTFDDLPDAAAWLENYAASQDVLVPAGLGSDDTSLPWAVLQAVQLRQSMERLTLSYQALLSEVFAALDLTDTPEVQAAPAPGSSECQPSF
jgi:hypothetical protein